MKEKKVPMRMCVGCRVMKPKRELLRVVRSPEGAVSIDATGRKPGRGAYVCPEKECITKAYKAHRLEKALEKQINDDVYKKLLEEMKHE